MSEESWWTFTHSPVTDDAHRIAGMMCVTRETTGSWKTKADPPVGSSPTSRSSG